MDSKIKELLKASSSAEEFCQKLVENGFNYHREEAAKMWEKLKILDAPLSPDELDAVAGGKCWCCSSAHPDQCKATVGAGSWCSSNDACGMFENVYTDDKPKNPDLCEGFWNKCESLW